MFIFMQKGDIVLMELLSGIVRYFLCFQRFAANFISMMAIGHDGASLGLLDVTSRAVMNAQIKLR